MPNAKIWQIAGGPSDRPYPDLFLKYGVALIGPGDPGPWTHGTHDERFGGGIVRRFAAELQHDDVLLLRSGQSEILSVGIVVGEYQYLQQFDDVSGWDLQHCRRVRWFPLPEPYRFGSAVFGEIPSRLARVRKHEVVAYARSFLASGLTRWQQAVLPELPLVEPLLEEVPESLRDVVGLARDFADLHWKERALGGPPKENEMVAHFVVPLLRALGWAPEHIAVEWRRIDVAVFSALPRTPQHCRFVIEAKRLGSGLEPALRQAEGYVSKLGIPRDVLVTDGFRYRAFDCTDDFAPVAYANLAHLKQSSLALFDILRRPTG